MVASHFGKLLTENSAKTSGANQQTRQNSRNCLSSKKQQYVNEKHQPQSQQQHEHVNKASISVRFAPDQLTENSKRVLIGQNTWCMTIANKLNQS